MVEMIQAICEENIQAEFALYQT